MNKERVTVDISVWSVLKVILALILVALVYYLREIIILVFIAFILTTTLEPTIDRLQRRKVPRGLAIAGSFAVIISIVYLAFASIIPKLSEQISVLAGNLPTIVQQLGNQLFANNPQLASDLSNQAIEYAKNFRASVPSGLVSGFFSTAAGVFGFFVSVIAVLALTFYMLLEKVGAGRPIFKYIPVNEKNRAIHIFDKITKKLSNWLKGQFVLSGFIGVITYIVLMVVGLRDMALALSLFAALMELIPVIGPFIALIPAALLALTISPATAIAVMIAYLIIQQIENHILVPQVMRKAVGLSPLVILVGILIGAKVLGIIGILLAVPIIASLHVILEELYGANSKTQTRH
ncbi:MAG: hypothetical protein UU65_C0002G0029 [candidate division CPR2 bacterium GW2011_GWC1_41_48]|uniref:Permease n=1 Tax=candidate division CPR2 bacterium GW2011_GWC1_41_48 TaxID=1618344 RepID=A0A0G0YI90_UNCC2|nr:MAG: hypothetical protein UT47_C0002G0275 [candidate division CPR2 bacterium GW2011_GWC2_39_35]KKR27275.1 MAG: hypothetical protein UT60_C0055G0002 [candidate division CPR2 bacterium GW2011_GWD2_39_7]KKR28160.1 MAG: hypothetical protein UT59_C0034G0008 [candidate division CPR2 bacterium GW2011_GWD1_39_7]KKS09251.1 MAG: hypothetical protein UU65_C0002G0029 [candidate division CPR2 bacterium GW2011_GWC1_41_48]OGB60309.1 MAG: hypothetical protein A2Y27_00465 [candidate division CPR2 bacterium G